MLKAKRIMVLLVATFSVVCSPALADKLPDMFIKSGSDYSATQSAVAECQKQSVNVHAPYSPAIAPIPNPVGLATAALLGGITQSIDESRMRRRFVRRCMIGQGFAPLVFDAAEEAAYRSLPTPAAREAWLKGTFEPEKFNAHLETSLSQLIPKIDVLEAKAFSSNGFIIDPDSLSASPTPVGAGGVMATAKVRYRRTAVLQHEFQFRFPGSVIETAAKGTPAFLSRVRETPDWNGAKGAWCFEVKLNGVPFMPSALVNCVGEDLGEYSVESPLMKPSERADFEKSNATVRLSFPERLELSEFDNAPSETLPLEWVLVRASKDKITTEARVVRGGLRFVIWRKEFALGADHTAVAALWTKRLEMRLDGGKVTANFRSDGDGSDWFTAISVPPTTIPTQPAG